MCMSMHIRVYEYVFVQNVSMKARAYAFLRVRVCMVTNLVAGADIRVRVGVGGNVCAHTRVHAHFSFPASPLPLCLPPQNFLWKQHYLPGMGKRQIDGG